MARLRLALETTVQQPAREWADLLPHVQQLGTLDRLAEALLNPAATAAFLEELLAAHARQPTPPPQAAAEVHSRSVARLGKPPASWRVLANRGYAGGLVYGSPAWKGRKAEEHAAAVAAVEERDAAAAAAAAAAEATAAALVAEQLAEQAWEAAAAAAAAAQKTTLARHLKELLEEQTALAIREVRFPPPRSPPVPPASAVGRGLSGERAGWAHRRPP
jgi:hypothetical protein